MDMGKFLYRSYMKIQLFFVKKMDWIVFFSSTLYNFKRNFNLIFRFVGKPWSKKYIPSMLVDIWNLVSFLDNIIHSITSIVQSVFFEQLSRNKKSSKRV